MDISLRLQRMRGMPDPSEGSGVTCLSLVWCTGLLPTAKVDQLRACFVRACQLPEQQPVGVKVKRQCV